MSKKKRDDELTRYMMWILVGLLMRRRIVGSKNKKMYTFVHPDGTFQDIHASAVNTLLNKKYLEYNATKKKINMTLIGFNLANSRLNKVGGMMYSMAKTIDTSKEIVCGVV